MKRIFLLENIYHQDCVPLEEAKDPQIHISKLHKYHHNPTEALVWEKGTLR
jgi:hypothetical protein